MSRVIACKGVSRARALVGAPSPVDVTVRGRRMQRGYKVWPIGVDIAKGELYGWLRQRIAEGGGPPPGYCHFPEYGEEFFRQLTAEHLVTVVNRRTGRAKMAWQVLPNRENHYLDARILARAAAAVLGLDRYVPPSSSTRAPIAPAAAAALASSPAPTTATELPVSPPRPRRESWLTGGRSALDGRGGWLARRRGVDPLL